MRISFDTLEIFHRIIIAFVGFAPDFVSSKSFFVLLFRSTLSFFFVDNTNVSKKRRVAKYNSVNYWNENRGANSFNKQIIRGLGAQVFSFYVLISPCSVNYQC